MKENIADALEIFNDTNKTLIMFILLILATVFRLKGYVNGTEWVDTIKTTTVSFFGTTTVMNVTGVIKDHLASKVQAIKDQSK